MDYKARYNEWIGFDDETKKELLAIADNEKEIEDRFYRDLEFGTAGLRGVIGAGTNRMNMYTVRKATQGLANFIIKQGGQDRGVAIAFDSRRMSVEFSEEAALCLCANGIKAYRFETLRPTPELSFALRELNCIAGIVITASHNPPEYNGYKVYWEDGAQITAPKDKQIIEEVNSITDYSVAKTMDRKTAEEKGLYKVIGKDIDDLYLAALKKQVIHPEIIKEMGKDLNIVYTPLHGTGMMPVKRIFEELGFENVHYVPVQSDPDENFSTVAYPNPEDPAAFKMALELAKEKQADIVLATDPDADRLGIYVYDTVSKEYVAFTGNMSAMIIGEYLLSQRKEAGTIAADGAMIKTIVSTNMADKIAEFYNIRLIEVLTGFKYIGEQIKFFEQTGKGNYEFGFEESYGCLVGTHARDKDAIVAVMSLCEAAAFYKKQGITLCDQMDNMYKKYGYFKEGLQNLVLKGIDGAQKIKEIMGDLRANAPKELAGYKVLAVRDYLNDTITDCEGNVKSTGLPKSDVMYYDLDKDAWVCVRPSGTEPKIKFYVGVKGSSSEDADKQMEVLKKALNTELVKQ